MKMRMQFCFGRADLEGHLGIFELRACMMRAKIQKKPQTNEKQVRMHQKKMWLHTFSSHREQLKKAKCLVVSDLYEYVF